MNNWSAPCKGRTGQFCFPDDCHAFVDCWRGRGTLKKCFPRSLVFNEATGQCDWPRNTPCVVGDAEEDLDSANRQSREIDLSMPKCEDYTALGYKCTKFWECSDNGEILSSPYDFYGEGLIDQRMVQPTKKSKRNTLILYKKPVGDNLKYAAKESVKQMLGRPKQRRQSAKQ